jgi:hypothetical protein
MLNPADLHEILERMTTMTVSEKSAFNEGIRKGLNAHPAGQMTMNVPMMDGKKLEGIQHKYRETMLFFPKEVCKPA